jgi:hypothetical protein
MNRESDLRESLIAEVERHFILHGGEDIKLWKHNTSVAYSTKSGTDFFLLYFVSRRAFFS